MRAFAIALVILVSARAYADDTVAGTAYNQAISLEAQGKWADACPLYEASYHADPQIGVLLHLAICHEKVGRIASAWTEYNDAADLAKARNDPREITARKLADALAPKVAKLYLAPPSKAITGLVVRRDGADITALVGTNLPIDPGEHEIVESAPGYLDWTTKITITGPTATPTVVDLPLLQKAPEAPVKNTDGTIKVTTQADAEILLDTKHVAVGHYEAKVKSGGHTLRVVAPGMRVYQSEIVVGENEERVIDVPLEKEGGPGLVVAGPPEVNPDAELGVDLASGVKLRTDHAAIEAVRVELAARRGRRVNFGVFVEAGSISTSNACGFSMPGAIPTTPYDFGPRNRFTNCTYIMPGIQLYIHILPHRRFDPYFGIAPGVRFGFVDFTPYLAGMAQTPVSDIFPAITTTVRVGLNYHPTPSFAAWQVGVFFDTVITIIGNEAPSDGPDANDTEKNAHFVSLLGGLRSTVTF